MREDVGLESEVRTGAFFIGEDLAFKFLWTFLLRVDGNEDMLCVENIGGDSNRGNLIPL